MNSRSRLARAASTDENEIDSTNTACTCAVFGHCVPCSRFDHREQPAMHHWSEQLRGAPHRYLNARLRRRSVTGRS